MSLRNRTAEEEDAAQIKLGPGQSSARRATATANLRSSSPDFNADNAGPLSTSEVKILLEQRETQPDNPYVQWPEERGREYASRLIPPLLLLSVFKKTLEYVTTFARFHDRETNYSVREYAVLLPSTRPIEADALSFPRKLQPAIPKETPVDQKTKLNFEMVQIANLCPLEAEEAKALIPRFVLCAWGGSGRELMSVVGIQLGGQGGRCASGDSERAGADKEVPDVKGGDAREMGWNKCCMLQREWLLSFSSSWSNTQKSPHVLLLGSAASFQLHRQLGLLDLVLSNCSSFPRAPPVFPASCAVSLLKNR